MRKLYGVFLALFVIACNPADELTSEESEIIACFGEDFPTVPSSGASGRGFTSEDMSVALFGPDPVDVPLYKDRDEQQLQARSEIFAGIGEEMYELLEKHLGFLEAFFTRSATSATVPGRMRLFRKHSLDPATVYYPQPGFHTAGKAVVDRTSRDKLTLSFDDWNNWGTITYLGSASTLDLIEDLLQDANPGISNTLEDTVTVSFDMVDRSQRPALRYQGQLTVELNLNRLRLDIDENSKDRKITVGGFAKWNISGMTLETMKILTDRFRYPGAALTAEDWDGVEVEESGSLAGKATTSFDVELTVDSYKSTFQESSVTEVNSGLVAIELDEVVWGLGPDRIELSGEVAVSGGGGGSRESKQERGYERRDTSIAGSGAVRDLRVNVRNDRGEVTLSTSGRLRLAVEESSSSLGDVDELTETGDGARKRASSNSVSISMPCGVSSIELAPVSGEVEKASLRFHGRYVDSGSSTSRQDWFSNGAYENVRTNKESMRLENFLFRATVAGSEAQGRMPAYVQESTSAWGENRQADGMLSGGYTAYFDAETSETRIAKSGYIGFDGMPSVFWTPSPLYISRESNRPCCSVDDARHDVDASGSFEFISGDVMRMGLGTRDESLVRDYTVNGTKIEPPPEEQYQYQY